MGVITGFDSTNPDFSGSTPPSLRDLLAQTAVNGLNRFIDLEFADKSNIPNTQSDVHAQQAASKDPSNPTPAPVADQIATFLPAIGLGLAAAVAVYLLIKAL